MQGVTSELNIPIYKEIAKKLGIKLEILAKEGEKYLISNRTKSFRDLAPEGKVFIKIGARNEALNTFWQQVNAKRKEIAAKENALI